MRIRLHAFAGLVSTCMLCAVATAQDANENDTQLVLRTYDVSDFFVSVPYYPANNQSDLLPSEEGLVGSGDNSSARNGNRQFTTGGMGGGMGGMGGGFGSLPADATSSGGGFFQVPNQGGAIGSFQASSDIAAGNANPLDVDLDSIIETITTTIAVDTWDMVGGEGSITALGNVLVVSQTANVQSQIQGLLELLRVHQSETPVIEVQAYWLPTDEAAKISEQMSQQPTDANLIQHVEELDGYTASIRCFSGQTVSLIAGEQSIYVANLVPVVGGDAVAYQPEARSLQEGLVLQVTPNANRDRTSATVDVRGRVLQIIDDAEQTTVAGQLLTNPAEGIDRPKVMQQRILTTVRVMNNQFTHVGSSTFPDHQQVTGLYLRVSIIDTQ